MSLKMKGRSEVLYGIFSIALGGFLQLASQRDIALNTWSDLVGLGGVYEFVAFALFALGFFFIIHAALSDALSSKAA
jgi:hypothetical protein